MFSFSYGGVISEQEVRNCLLTCRKLLKVYSVVLSRDLTEISHLPWWPALTSPPEVFMEVFPGLLPLAP